MNHPALTKYTQFKNFDDCHIKFPGNKYGHHERIMYQHLYLRGTNHFGPLKISSKYLPLAFRSWQLHTIKPIGIPPGDTIHWTDEKPGRVNAQTMGILAYCSGLIILEAIRGELATLLLNKGKWQSGTHFHSGHPNVPLVHMSPR